MRPDPISLCERQFITSSLLENVRLDQRSCNEFRQVKLVVGAESGTALATMGNTKVMCAVSSELVEPSRARPQQGVIAVEVDMSPMADPHNEHNRLGERGGELSRLLELVLRDSRCIDVESLCVRAGREVWKVRVDVRVLEDGGSVLDCASLAAVAALYHSRRPHVTVQPHKTKIHSEFEKGLIPLNIYHMPICVSFGFANDGQTIVVDASERESACLDGCLVVACNKRREVCALHQTSSLVLETEVIESCVRRALQRVVDLSDLVATVVADDAEKRSKYERPVGFETTIDPDFLTCFLSQPNELIAPAVTASSAAAAAPAKHVSVVLNENPLEAGASQLADAEERALAAQVDNIAQSVTTVDIDQAKQQQEKKGSRKREKAEVDDLIDDLEGDVVTLPGSEPAPQEEMVDLTAARKPKTKRKLK